VLTLLTDSDVDRLVSMREAVHAVEGALARKAANAFLTPPRHYFGGANGVLAFTIGGDTREGVVGFRVYGTFAGSGPDDQLVVVFDARSGALRGIVQGERIGAMRTGALGGLAIKYGAREDARTVAVIGSGTQARTQLEAAAVVRDLAHVRVYSRSQERRESFAAEMSAHLNLSIHSVGSPDEAIAGADIVIVATDSRVPVFDASLIEPGQHVTTIRLGRGQHELDAAVADRAVAIFTDSIDQLRAYPGGFFLADRIHAITDLALYAGRQASARAARNEITLYLSAGLSGTEVVVADLALHKTASRRRSR
jgi:ornithine cyclodeaminase